MLSEAHLQNFKSHKNTHLELDHSRLHALVGHNSSGKTSILQALHSLSRLASVPCKEIFNDERDPQVLSYYGSSYFAVKAKGFWGYGEKQINWQASYQYDLSDRGWHPTLLSGKIQEGEIQEEPNRQTGWSSSLSAASYPIPQALKYSVHLKLIATNLAKAAYSESTTPRVEFDGSGLAPTLDYLRNEAPDQFRAAEEMLQRVVPDIQGISIRRAEVVVSRPRSIEADGHSIVYEDSQTIIGQEVVFKTKVGEKIPAHAVSEGTILTLGLLTVLMNPRLPNLILLDDIQQGLHPRAQRELLVIFQEIIRDNPNLQIIFSTHSPYILDALEPSQVHVLTTAKTGYTQTKRLDEHPDAEWAKQTLTTGEFWDAVEEDWVAEG